MSDLIFQNEAMVLRYHPVERIVHHQMLRRPKSAEFREVLNKGFECLVRYKASKWLSDDRQFTVLDEADEKWAQTEWFGKVMGAGWKYWAVIKPEKAVGQLQMKRNASTMKLGGVTVGTFDTYEEAFAWLKAVDQVKKTG